MWWGSFGRVPYRFLGVKVFWLDFLRCFYIVVYITIIFFAGFSEVLPGFCIIGDVLFVSPYKAFSSFGVFLSKPSHRFIFVYVIAFVSSVVSKVVS